jgi:SAM-dependent methyltransferase
VARGAEHRAQDEFSAFQRRASSELEGGAPARALAIARDAARRWPHAFWPQYLIGRALEALDRPSEAADAHRQAVASNPSHPEAGAARRAADRILGPTAARPASDAPARPPPGQALYLPTEPTDSRGEWAISLGRPLRKRQTRPTPPIQLREYGESARHHLESGRRDVAAMLSALEECSFDWAGARRVLEFGCANGRMIRHLEEHAESREIWGVDIQADKIVWAMENLSPPFNFAVTTTVPHLPFPDNHFDLVFAGSIFTHLGELHVAWLLELARITSNHGMLYLTFHDENAAQVVVAEDSPRVARIKELMNRSSFADVLPTGEFGMVSMTPYGPAMLSMVRMSSSYVRHVTEPFLRLIRTFPRAFSDLQTAYVFTPRW